MRAAQTPLRWLVGLGVLAPVALACGLPWLVSSFDLSRFDAVLYLSVAVLSLNMLVGLNGQISLGQAAFWGLGAYTVSILVGDHGWSYWTAIPAGIVVSAFAGLITSLPALRLRGLYVALTTLGVALAFPNVLDATTSLTGGPGGKTIIARFGTPAWTGLSNGQWMYFSLLGMAVLAILLVRNIKTSRIGRAMGAIRDNDLVAESFGVRLARTKVLAFSISAGLAGLAGGMFAIVTQYASPDDFGLNASVNLFVGMAVGGSASVFGALLGGGFLEFVPSWIPGLGVDPQLTPLIYGGILVVFVLFFRQGLGGAVGAHTSRLFAARSPPDLAADDNAAASVSRGHAPEASGGVVRRMFVLRRRG